MNIPYIDMKFMFRPFEGIHIEYSYKFEQGNSSPDNPDKQGQVGWIAKNTGYECRSLFIDSNEYFMDALLRVNKSGGVLES